MYTSIHKTKQSHKPGYIGATLLLFVLIVVLLLSEIPRIVPAHAADAYYVTFSTRNFGIQSLHAQAENLRNPQQATFRLDTGASIWYGIDFNSLPSSLRPVAVDPLNDLVSTLSVHYGLLPAAGIMPINLDGSLAQQILLQASFSGPGQRLQMTLNPFNGGALTLDVIHILLDILSNSTLSTQVGLLIPGNLSKILSLVSHISDLSAFIKDFGNGVEAELLHHSWDAFTDARKCAKDFFDLLGQQIELQDLATMLAMVLGPTVGGIATMLASYAAGIGEFVTIAKLSKTLADFLLSLGSYLFQHNVLPTVTLQTVATGGTPVPPVATTPVPTPIPSGTITEFPVTTTLGIGINSSIASGSDGNIWFTEAGAYANGEVVNKIGLSTPSGAITEFPIPTADSNPSSITSGPDGNLWFTETCGITEACVEGKIGRITPSGIFTEFPLSTINSLPDGITLGSDGNLWFTEPGSNNIGRITSSGTITEFPIPTADSNPTDITSGPDGNLWFTEGTSNVSQIGRITPNGTITEFPTPTTVSYPKDITSGPDGNLWFTEEFSNKIGRITLDGTITEFSIPTVDGIPNGITSGPDGNLWFTEISSNVSHIGRITPNGTITEFLLPTSNGDPISITPGPDGNLWFTEEFSNKIGRITP